jgi:hypothetical protein
MSRLSLLHTVVQFGCNLGANVLTQYGNIVGDVDIVKLDHHI